MQSVRDAERTLDELRSLQTRRKPRNQAAGTRLGPRQPALSALAAALDPSLQEQDPPQDSGPQPWDRRPSESHPGQSRLPRLPLPRPRQVAPERPTAASKAPDTARLPGRWRTWCVDHEWVARAAAYDRHQQSAPQWRKRTAGRSRKAAHRRDAERELQKGQDPSAAPPLQTPARRAYRQNQRRWHDEGRLCRGRTRTGRRLQTPRRARRHSTATRTLSGRPGKTSPAASRLLLQSRSASLRQGLPPSWTSTQTCPCRNRHRPKYAALLWIRLTRDRLPARLLYADDCPAALRTAIRICAQKIARRVSLRLQIEPPRRHPQNQ